MAKKTTTKKTKSKEAIAPIENIDEILNMAIEESKDFVPEEKPVKVEEKVEITETKETAIEEIVENETNEVVDTTNIPDAPDEKDEEEKVKEEVVVEEEELKTEVTTEETMGVQDEAALKKCEEKKVPWYVKRAMEYTYGDYGFTN